jgi:hypothetical protein
VYWRFTIRQLLIWTTFVGLGCVALRSASPIWTSVMYGLLLSALSAAVLLPIFRTGSARAYWIGFAVCGFLYLVVFIYGQALGSDYDSSENPLATNSLITSRLATHLYDFLYEPRLHGHGISGFSYEVRYPENETDPAYVDFLNTSHALWTLFLAACGGWLARWIYATGPAAKKKVDNTVS